MRVLQPLAFNIITIKRPDLYKLHNQSGELWSPLVALAAFFEEQGKVTELLDAISSMVQ